MGISYHVVGIKPADEKFRQMKAIWDACEVVGINPPDEVGDFFEGETPDNTGVRVDFDSSAFAWENDHSSGFQVNLKELDPSITMIRFVISC